MTSLSLWGQDYGFKRGAKNNDYLLVTNKGITFSIGPTWQMTPKENPIYELTDNSGSRGLYTVDPAGKVGFFGEIGFVYFPAWKGLIPIKKLKKSRLMDYVDVTVGYRQYRGTETTHIDYTNALGQITSSNEGFGTYSNGLIYGRFDAHTLLYFGKKKIDVARKKFIDQSLGFNVDYNIVSGPTDYDANQMDNIKPHSFYGPLTVQMHYGLSVGIRLTRAWMILPGVSIPFLNFTPLNGFNARMNWFSSSYWPIQGQIRMIKLFERKPKCGAYGDPKDVELDKKFRLGN